MNVTTRVKKYLSTLAGSWLLSWAYVLGLTILYPYVALGMPTPGVLITAGLFILGGILGTYRYQRTLPRTLRYLGLVTLIPGSAGVILLLFGPATLAAVLPEGITPVVETYIAFAVPKAATLTVSYFVLGVTLYYLGKKLR